MDREESLKKPREYVRQRYFIARELQLTIAILVVLALLGGIFLQSISAALSTYLELETPALGIFLVIGYIIIVVFFAIIFSHRLVGPFKRLEYEMMSIAAGNLDARLSVRAKDDLHVRNFVKHVNSFIAKFEDMSKEYNRLNSTISTRLSYIINELSKETYDREKIRKELQELQRQIHEFREKW